MAEPSRDREAGEISVRNLLELVVVFLLVYVIFQVAPVVVTRVNFLNELEVIANSPVQETEHQLRQKIFEIVKALDRKKREVKIKATIANFSPQIFYVKQNRKTFYE